MSTFTSFATFTVEHCCNCGVAFGLDNAHMSELRRTHDWFYCPNGHRQHYTGLTEAERLQRELDAEKRRTEHERERAARFQEQRIRAEHQLRTVKGHQTRLKNRIAGGACPCCNRTFENLGRHMATKHPDFTVKPR